MTPTIQVNRPRVPDRPELLEVIEHAGPREPAAAPRTLPLNAQLKFALPPPMDTLRVLGYCPDVRSVGTKEGTEMILASTEWVVGIALGVVVIAVAAAILIMIVALSERIAKQAATAEEAVEVVRAQTDELGGVGQINDSGVRILHSARALRKVAVGK
jgi:hypothetical protein